MINLSDVATGDQVVVQDRNQNVATGTVERQTVTPNQTEMLTITAFGRVLPFATRRDSHHRWKSNPECRCVGHTPALFGGTDD